MIDEEEEKQKLKEQHESEDFEMSSSLSIVKMTLNSLGIILDKVIDSTLPLEEQHKFEMSESQLEAMTALLTEFEENGDIVEGVYSVLEKFLRLAHGDSQHGSVRVMEGSVDLMKQAVKHTASYQCGESLAYLKVLIDVSTKFENQEETQDKLRSMQPQKYSQLE